MNIRLSQLRALVGVIQYGGIRSAARHLFISPAALTKSLRRLEDEVGLSLLTRSSRGVRLTSAGERLHARATLVTRQIDLAGEEMREIAGGYIGKIRVAATPLVTLIYMGQALKQFRQRYPNAGLLFCEGLIRRVLPRLRDGTVDLAFVGETGDSIEGEFHTQHIRTHSQIIAVREAHPVLANPSPKALSELEWIVTEARSAERGSRLHTMFERAGVDAPSRFLVCDSVSTFALLRNSDAATIVPTVLMSQPECRATVAVDVPELNPGDFKIMLWTRNDAPLTTSMDYFIHCVVQACKT